MNQGRTGRGQSSSLVRSYGGCRQSAAGAVGLDTVRVVVTEKRAKAGTPLRSAPAFQNKTALWIKFDPAASRKRLQGGRVLGNMRYSKVMSTAGCTETEAPRSIPASSPDDVRSVARP